MIWYYLSKFLQFWVRMFKVPTPQQFAFINVNTPCPVCGHERGVLRAIDAKSGNDTVVACLHSCQVCFARWIEEPVVKAGQGPVIMAAPADATTAIDSAFLSKAVTRKGEALAAMKQ